MIIVSPNDLGDLSFFPWVEKYSLVRCIGLSATYSGGFF